MSVSVATQEAIWLRRLLTGLGYAPKSATVLYNDNLGCISLTRNPTHHARTKHIDIKHHFIREAVEEQVIDTKYKPTSMMPADVLTKGLGRIKHNRFGIQIGLIGLHSSSSGSVESWKGRRCDSQ
jgi:hypothetical protein